MNNIRYSPALSKVESSAPRGCRHCLTVLLITCFGVFPALAVEKNLPDNIQSFDFRTPPNFGYFIGDIITHHIDITVRKPYVLAREHLPKPGPSTRWLDIRSMTVDQKASNDGNRYYLTIAYQLFKGVRKTTRLAIPPVSIKFVDDKEKLDFATPEWPFSIAVLIPDNLKDDEIDPAAPVKPTLLPAKTHFGLIIPGILFLLGYLAWLYDKLPFLPKRAGPFSRAFGKIQKLSRGNPRPDAYESALKYIHQAINKTAGTTVFADQLDHYCQKNPLFEDARNGLKTFFEISRQVFFENTTQKRQEYPLTWLESFCQYLSVREKRIP